MGKRSEKKEPDVKVHHSAGCALCGNRGAHTHTQRDWRTHVEGTPLPWDREKK